MNPRLKRTCLAVAVAAMVSVIASCAHHQIQPAEISASANPTEEVRTLANDLETAKSQRVNVLAPENFEKAQKNTQEAQDRLQKGKSNEKILESVSYGRAYLNRANDLAKRSQEELADVMEARDLAIQGGGQTYTKELAQLDKKLEKYSSRIEADKKLDRQGLTELRSEYLDLELKSIKAMRLGEAKNTLTSAEKLGAATLTPQAYRAATEKIAVAEKSIETDRHNEQVVSQVSADASQAAKRTLTLVQTARQAKKQTPEEIAREIETRNAEIARADAQLSAAQLEAQSRERQMAEQRGRANEAESEAGTAQAKLRELQAREQFQLTLTKAQSLFKKNEAEVYRQGDNLVVRLKGMNFASGKADLSPKAIPVLGKVKQVIHDLNPKQVVIEGHTDSSGPQSINKRISEERAGAVADYFVADQALSKDQVEVIGAGDDNPIASNKTQQGRAANRRVDIIIKTPETKTE